MKPFPPKNPCPCRSGDTYMACCRPFHQGKTAPTPVKLMRARYSAYALQNAEFIMQTTHRESPHYKTDKRLWRAEILAFTQQTEFIALTILNTTADTVTFRAGLLQNQRDASFTEHSTFKRMDGKWQYVSGVYD